MSDGQDTRPGSQTGPATTGHRPDAEIAVPPGDVKEAVPGAEPSGAAVEAGEPLVEGRQASLWGDAWRHLKRNPLFILSAVLITIFVLMAAWPSLFTSFYPGYASPHEPCTLSQSLVRPSSTYWFGFDLQGCDLYAQTIYGAQVSITIGLLTVGFAALIAVFFGTLAGYYGRFTDTLIARIADIWFAVPLILGGIVVLNALGHEFWLVTAVLVLFGWPTMLRLMRSAVLSAKEDDYVEAARALGASDMRIMFRHILPNAITPVIVYGTILVGIVIGVEATLSFLGVGLQLPAISWGLMISGAQYRILSAPYLLLFPASFLALAILAFILMGDALRDAFDPKQR